MANFHLEVGIFHMTLLLYLSSPRKSQAKQPLLREKVQRTKVKAKEEVGVLDRPEEPEEGEVVGRKVNYSVGSIYVSRSVFLNV